MRVRSTAVALLTMLVFSGTAHADSTSMLARQTCEYAVEDKLAASYGGSGSASYDGAEKVKQHSGHRLSVTGSGRFDSDAGRRKFSYACDFDSRSNKASKLSVKVSGGSKRASGGNEVAGAVVGALVAGAIASAIDNDAHHNTNSSDGYADGQGYEGEDGWYSPAEGIECNQYQGMCTENGSFSADWTDEVFP